MSDQPRLHVVAPRGDVRAVALVLHGGREHGTGPVRSTQLAVLRMVPFAAALRHAGREHGLAVARLRYLVRGWNGTARSPVPDVMWALDRLAARYAGAAVALVGHSMGGRAAIYAASHDAVRAVVGLAPWLESGDPIDTVTGRHVLLAHGERDRITSPKASAAWLHRASDAAAGASLVRITGEGHAMLRRAPLWHALTSGYVTGVLCGTHLRPAGRSSGAEIVAKALAGDAAIVV